MTFPWSMGGSPLTSTYFIAFWKTLVSGTTEFFVFYWQTIWMDTAQPILVLSWTCPW